MSPEEYEELGKRANAEYLVAHGGKFPEDPDACRCAYCRRVFKSFIARLEAGDKN